MYIEYQTNIQNKILENLLVYLKLSPETMKHNLRYFQQRGDIQEEGNNGMAKLKSYTLSHT